MRLKIIAKLYSIHIGRFTQITLILITPSGKYNSILVLYNSIVLTSVSVIIRST